MNNVADCQMRAWHNTRMHPQYRTTTTFNHPPSSAFLAFAH